MFMRHGLCIGRDGKLDLFFIFCKILFACYKQACIISRAHNEPTNQNNNMKNTTWNTYKTTGYTHDVAQDQRSAGGVHHYQVRKTKDGWQKRIRQSNGRYESFGEVSEMTNAEGAAAYETAKNS
jgi:hypothetical protein